MLLHSKAHITSAASLLFEILYLNAADVILYVKFNIK